MPFAAWRVSLLPASFGGAEFKVEAGGFGGGRRLVMHEYAHLDTPFTEDMGRKGRRWQFTAYCIGPGYLDDRDALIAVCNAEGPFTLVHPSLGSEQAHCDVCNPVETREKGGFCSFELVFFEAGQNPGVSATSDTQAQAQGAASASNTAAAAGADADLANATPVTTPLPKVDGGYSGIPASYPNAGRIGGIGSA